MPSNISKLGKILKTLNRLEGSTLFNASLPVKIEVKKELNPITFLIKVGNKELETKTDIPLKAGEKYFAEIKELKNSIQITNLKPYPKILKTLDIITPQKEFVSKDKKEILTHLANAKTKDDFLFFMNILIAFEKKIYHMFITDKRKALFQYKKEKDKIRFYGCFSVLGELEGTVTATNVNIYTPYSSTMNLINEHKNSIDLNVSVFLKEVKTLFEFNNSLIDIKV